MPRAGRRLLFWAVLAAGLALPALAQEVRRVGVEIVVNHAVRQPGPIDPSAQKLHETLRREFRYESLRVLSSRRLQLALDEIGGLKLPNGRWVRVRPLSVDDERVLIAVEVEGLLQTDLKMRNHHKVVIGAEPYKNGKLIITLEPDF